MMGLLWTLLSRRPHGFSCCSCLQTDVFSSQCSVVPAFSRVRGLTSLGITEKTVERKRTQNGKNANVGPAARSATPYTPRPKGPCAKTRRSILLLHDPAQPRSCSSTVIAHHRPCSQPSCPPPSCPPSFCPPHYGPALPIAVLPFPSRSCPSHHGPPTVLARRPHHDSSSGLCIPIPALASASQP